MTDEAFVLEASITATWLLPDIWLAKAAIAQGVPVLTVNLRGLS